MKQKLVHFRYIILILLTLVVGLIVLQPKGFRVVRITPDPSKKVATSTPFIEVTFSEGIADGENIFPDRVKSTGNIIRSVEVDNKIMRLYIDSLIKDKNYDITIKDIKSKHGENLPLLNISFEAEYIPYNKLSKQDQQRQISKTDQDNVEDPILEHLPHGDVSFYLKASFEGTETEDGSEPATKVADQKSYVLVLRATLYLTGADVRQNRDAAIVNYKNQVTEFIKSKGLSPENYEIFYEVYDPPF